MKKAAVALVVVLIIVGYALLQNQKKTDTIPASSSQDNSSGKNNEPSLTTGPTTSPSSSTNLKDGTYTGDIVNVFYGNLQVQAVISGGKITDILYPVFPSDSGHTQEVSNFALPQLKQEAIQSQSANVTIVSGATQTSQGFIQSFSSALAKAQ